MARALPHWCKALLLIDAVSSNPSVAVNDSGTRKTHGVVRAASGKAGVARDLASVALEGF